jgi:hypothetical protein
MHPKGQGTPLHDGEPNQRCPTSKTAEPGPTACCPAAATPAQAARSAGARHSVVEERTETEHRRQTLTTYRRRMTISAFPLKAAEVTDQNGEFAVTSVPSASKFLVTGRPRPASSRPQQTACAESLRTFLRSQIRSPAPADPVPAEKSTASRAVLRGNSSRPQG